MNLLQAIRRYRINKVELRLKLLIELNTTDRLYIAECVRERGIGNMPSDFMAKCRVGDRDEEVNKCKRLIIKLKHNNKEK